MYPFLQRSTAAFALSTLTLAPLPALAASSPSASHSLARSHFAIRSTLRIDTDKGTATLPLHKGSFKGMPVYYVITDASNRSAARALGVNFAPRLALVTEGCPGCAQVVKTAAPLLGAANVEFAGVPDFAPMRMLVPGPTGFPPVTVQPGAKGDLYYSPFVKIAGNPIVYNASIVATGNAPFDVEQHTNTADRVLGIDPAKMTVELLVVRAFAYGKRIMYLSSEASDPLTATIERATFVPGLALSPFAGGGAYPDTSARAEIFATANGKVANPSPPGQGLAHVIVSGANAKDAGFKDGTVVAALRAGGDAHNVLDNWPTVPNAALAAHYSPLWDLQIAVYSPAAVAAGLNRTQTDANRIRQLSVRKVLTSPGGVLPVTPVNIVINCPALAFMDTSPIGPQVPKPAGAL